ncbi:MAG: MBL fold metallo-hydrolase [Chloroflexota bacterium]|nr:MAG: MBL fold metallo-hydrolase [Chloroflexota bacterium]
MELRHREVGPWPMNSYALVCPNTGASVLFDPGANPGALEEMLSGSEPTAILITHTHFDHIDALDALRSRLEVPVMSHAGPHVDDVRLSADRHLDTGDTVQVGDFVLRVLHAPGHTADQICFLLENDHRAIVGDTIFEGGPGKTWSPAGFDITRQTLRQVVLPWSDETICYPGHGPSFRLGDQRPAIEAFLAKDHGRFSGDATWDM